MASFAARPLVASLLLVNGVALTACKARVPTESRVAGSGGGGAGGICSGITPEKWSELAELLRRDPKKFVEALALRKFLELQVAKGALQNATASEKQVANTAEIL